MADILHTWLLTRVGKIKFKCTRYNLLAVQLRLTQEQNSQQQAATAEITELEEALTLEEEDSKKAGIKDEIAKKKTELEDMLTEFEVSDHL